MALSYRLSIATELKPFQALNIVKERLNLEWSSSSCNSYLFGADISLGAYLEDDCDEEDSDCATIKEAFGFTPTIAVWFKFINTGNYDKAVCTMFQVTMTLLSQKVSGDAVLLFNGEQIVLQRLKGQLLLNDESKSVIDGKSQPWITVFLSEITLPYQLRDLPSPLLHSQEQ